ncbi:uncharacterized protein MONBRDRAFT_11173 [Monosiga brevicollis MX1]|uniref:Uncharacterized protein n=1 Tax=Monosiga brevicollis TaxID=81824 RepID=A9V8E9_MONBE|nr:uncharacterized protein MONBRDRAFT_11173 [Monosiga brevicollis MX1]EDQ86257.1 predicted protein [Monosiga brevicollis MX1]|eukprot:XP_001748927.1 hypothetical protein [Monosiga brevicollis MX1]
MAVTVLSKVLLAAVLVLWATDDVLASGDAFGTALQTRLGCLNPLAKANYRSLRAEARAVALDHLLDFAGTCDQLAFADFDVTGQESRIISNRGPGALVCTNPSDLIAWGESAPDLCHDVRSLIPLCSTSRWRATDTCTADDLEPNSYASPYALDDLPAALSDLSLCDGPDAYAISVCPSCKVTVSVTYVAGPGSLSLGLFDSQVNAYAAQTQGSGGSAQIVFTNWATSTREMSIDVYGSFAGTYALSAAIEADSGTRPTTTTPAPCTADSFEPNGYASPYALSGSSTNASDLTLCGEADSYSFSLCPGCYAHARVEFDRSYGNIDIGFFSGTTAAYVAQGAGTGDYEEVGYINPTGSTINLQLDVYGSFSRTYSLVFTIASEGPPGKTTSTTAPCLPDALEPSSFSDPYALTGNNLSFADLTLCGVQDSYSINVPSGEAITVQVNFDNVQGGINLGLFNPNTNTYAAEGRSAIGRVWLQYTNAGTARTFNIDVYGSNRGSYTLSVVVAPPPTTTTPPATTTTTAASSSSTQSSTTVAPTSTSTSSPGTSTTSADPTTTATDVTTSPSSTSSSSTISSSTTSGASTGPGSSPTTSLPGSTTTASATMTQGSTSATTIASATTAPSTASTTAATTASPTTATTPATTTDATAPSTTTTSLLTSTGSYSSAPLTCPDSYEPNNRPSEAYLVSNGFTAEGISLCEEDVDMYRLEVCAGGSVSIQVSFSHAQGDLDARLWADGQVVATGYSTSDSEQLEYTEAPDHVPQTLVLEVFGVKGAANAYSLTVHVTGCECTCPPDSRRRGTRLTTYRVPATRVVGACPDYVPSICLAPRDDETSPLTLDLEVNRVGQKQYAHVASSPQLQGDNLCWSHPLALQHRDRFQFVLKNPEGVRYWVSFPDDTINCS